ncbi:hypothetical protein SS50377_22295 [Spironucleus salmonicida]|uniref:Uncharacterized protein n=1 Tax=Spironucleus salmonicida TaxID=348837 RepID=V6LCK5_9EUKA|nr:hypothetical protein SS50377_22295 [Spironucleus salmonicida]|eukprot:EST42210.1 Hypothetical protein SS50377_18512 [Spironucleus salmonicida]
MNYQIKQNEDDTMTLIIPSLHNRQIQTPIYLKLHLVFQFLIIKIKEYDDTQFIDFSLSNTCQHNFPGIIIDAQDLHSFKVLENQFLHIYSFISSEIAHFIGPHPFSNVINLDLAFRLQNPISYFFIPTRAGGNIALFKKVFLKDDPLQSYIDINCAVNLLSTSAGTNKRKTRKIVSFLRQKLSFTSETKEFYNYLKNNANFIENKQFQSFFNKYFTQINNELSSEIFIEIFESNEGSDDAELVNFSSKCEKQILFLNFRIMLCQIIGFQDFQYEKFTSGCYNMLQIKQFSVIAKLGKINIQQNSGCLNVQNININRDIDIDFKNKIAQYPRFKNMRFYRQIKEQPKYVSSKLPNYAYIHEHEVFKINFEFQGFVNFESVNKLVLKNANLSNYSFIKK